MSAHAKYQNVAARAEQGLCSGCGVCSAVCNSRCLTMKFNACGELAPMLTGTCANCSACLNVCPFVDSNPDEDYHGETLFSGIESIKRSEQAGLFHRCFVGYSPDDQMRWNGASGGMLTWLLCELLECGKVDYVISVGRAAGLDGLFRFRVMSEPKEVCECSKSVYYPVELSDVLRIVMKNQGRYAVVGLPCVCKAIRNAQMHSSELSVRITYVLGLICAGSQANRHFAEALADAAGLKGELKDVVFRNKTMGQPAINFITTMWTLCGESRSVSFFEVFQGLWSSRAFALRGCGYCDDVFAECADAAFMDAWLDDYPLDSKGVSLVLSRRADLSVILDSVSTLKDISIADVVRSQPVSEKRQSLKARLLRARILGSAVPKKRVSASLFPVKNFVKIMLTENRASAARRNLSDGRAYDAFRLSLLPVIIADILLKAIRPIRASYRSKRQE